MDGILCQRQAWTEIQQYLYVAEDFYKTYRNPVHASSRKKVSSDTSSVSTWWLKNRTINSWIGTEIFFR